MSQPENQHSTDMDNNKVHFILLVIVLQLIQNSVVYGRPGSDLPFHTEGIPEGCKKDVGTDELCQKCAKHTKSNVVYPMCCNNIEDAQDFCTRFLTYGLQ